jgi:hypothetical protein
MSVAIEDRWNIRIKQIEVTRDKINSLRRNLTKLMKSERELREQVLDDWRSHAK